MMPYNHAIMDTEKQDDQRSEDYGDESLNTASAGDQQSNEAGLNGHKKGGIHNNALYAAGMGRPATAQVDPHINSDLAQTGTNISYEGPTAAGAGGSSGTGYTSGQAGTGASISTDSDYDQAAVGKPSDQAEGNDNDDNIAGDADEAQDEINGQR